MECNCGLMDTELKNKNLYIFLILFVSYGHKYSYCVRTHPPIHVVARDSLFR